MARRKNPNRVKAFEIYRENQGNITNRKIADMLGEDEKKIAVWKQRDNWADALQHASIVVQQKRNNVVQQKKRGAPKGNRNSVGHGAPRGNKNAVGHGAPKGNQNALSTGEYATIYFDMLSDKEREILGRADMDPLAQINETIQLLAIRERRMLENINNLKAQKILAEYEDEMMPDGGEFRRIKSRTRYTKLLIDKIVAAEDALTRVQEKLIKAIETKHRIQKDLKSEQSDLAENDVVIVRMPEKRPRL